MKVYVYCDELYPDYRIETMPGKNSESIDLTEEELVEFKAAVEAYDKWQRRIYKEAK